MLNGKELIEKEIIVGPIEDTNIAQHGVDLNLIKIESIDHRSRGGVFEKQKTRIADYKVVQYSEYKEEGNKVGWLLEPGTYAITFAQGCNIPKDFMLLIRQRSSMLRNGTSIHSSVFDAGFKTDNIGTIMIVTHQIFIEYNARIAQVYGHDCLPVENLYDGQFQNDSQRSN